MIKILMTSFNNAPYLKRCLDSLSFQEHEKWVCYVADDVSTDKSLELIKALTRGDDRFVLIENLTKRYQVGNYHHIISNFGIDNQDICITVDGDDWLPDRNVLDRVIEAYADNKTWMTWGSMLSVSGRRTYNPTLDNIFRFRFTHVPFHLRTWKAFLWRRIQVEDLQGEDGHFFRVAGDLSFMLPMLEMAGEYRCKFLESLNYCYNDLNPLCNHFLRSEEQLRNDWFIRNQKRNYFRKLFL